MKEVSLVLAHATLSLYHADANGNPILSSPIWMGARTEEVELNQSIEEIPSTPSGALHVETEHGFEHHEIRISRMWVLPTKASERGLDYAMPRGPRHVLVVYGEDRATGIWHKRTYYGVSAQIYNLRSLGVLNFGANQSFRAQYFLSDGGGADSSGQPISTTSICEFPVGFTHEPPLVINEYLIGVYQFPFRTKIKLAKAIAFASQTAATIVTLEVAGVLSAHSLTLPAGAVNQEVSASATLNLVVEPNQALRWKCTSGPGNPPDACSMAGLTMNMHEE